MAMNDDSQRPIVIKRIKKAAHGHHGGAWKIAYADFVTAMMAFFLLMWLLGSTTKATLDGIAEYFKTPLKVALAGGSGAGEATSVIKGGGLDLSKSAGQVKKGEPQAEKRSINLQQAKSDQQAAQLRQEQEALKEVKAKIEKMIDENPALKQFKKQILLDITSEGLRIQIVDEQNRPMFELGRTQLQPYTKVILHEIAKVLNDVPNRVSLSGHTDAKAYAGGEKGYSNWELSADRANASRRELVVGGMDDNKMLRVVGLASAVPFEGTTDPLSPANRRISIIVMNKKTEEAITKGGETVKVDGKNESGAVAAPPGDGKGKQ